MSLKIRTRAFWAALLGASILALPSGNANAATELTIYTAWENDDLKLLKSAFEKDNPDITINWVRDSTGVVTAKLMAEKDNPQADVIWASPRRASACWRIWVFCTLMPRRN